MPVGRRSRKVVRKLDTMAVLRVAIVLHACLLVVGLTAGVIVWNVAAAQGWVDKYESFVAEMFALESFTLRGDVMFGLAFVGGLLLSVLGAVAWVLMSVLYNLTSDVVGGVQLVLLEDERSLGPVAPGERIPGAGAAAAR